MGDFSGPGPSSEDLETAHSHLIGTHVLICGSGVRARDFRDFQKCENGSFFSFGGISRGPLSEGRETHTIGSSGRTFRCMGRGCAFNMLVQSVGNKEGACLESDAK